jgi:hypothetical protein
MSIKIDMREVEQLADRIGAARDQIPFAMSKTLNDAAFITRGVLTKETWPQHVSQRNPSFPSAVMHVNKATKDNLEVEITETRDSTVSLKAHAEGGVKVAPKRFAIPMPAYREGKMTQHGLRLDARARAIINRYPKQAVRITDKGIFVADKGGRLRLVFVFKQAVNIKKDVPIYEDFAQTVETTIQRELEPALLMAMRTRKI